MAVPIPEPGPGEVLLKVDAAGLCHTDLYLMEWPAGTVPYTLPFTLGQAVDAYQRLRRGEVRGRAVITPGTSHQPDVVSV